MLDRAASALIKPLVSRLAKVMLRVGLNADQLTIGGFLIGIFAALSIANGAYLTGAVLLFISRLCDALDGAVARLTQATDRGGFIDIALDFLFYAFVVLAFGLADPLHNALAAAVLLTAFMGNSSSFLAFAVIATKRSMVSLAYPDKSFYFLGGLTEATETLIFFAAMCWWPTYFATLAYVFAALCGVTVVTRLWWGWRAFSS
jgi:phosphatidylglycerophosphate synthase